MVYLAQVVRITSAHIPLKLYHTYTGRHNCLWCTITSARLKEPLHVRGRQPTRTLGTIKADNQLFIAAGGHLKNAKHFNNCIREPLLSIPLDHVRHLLSPSSSLSKYITNPIRYVGMYSWTTHHTWHLQPTVQSIGARLSGDRF